MKKIISLIITLVMVAALALTATAANPADGLVTDGLIVHYTFDEYDPATQTYAGTVANAPLAIEKMMGTANVSDGPVGKAAYFDGETVFQADPTVFGTNYNALNALTYSMWVYADAFPVTKEDGNQYPVTTFSWDVGSYHLIFVWGDYPGSCQMTVKGATAPTGGAYSTSTYYRTPPAETGKWVLMTWTYDVNTATANYYANGELLETATYTAAVPINIDGISIGGHYEYKNFYKGYIDDLRIYDRVLSADEISQLYLSGNDAVVPAPTAVADVEATQPETTAALYEPEATAAPADDTTAEAPAETTAAPVVDTTADAGNDAETTVAPAVEKSGCGSAIAGTAAITMAVAILGGALIAKKEDK